ncbi:zinc transporter ZIP1-like [Argopecten irradians]|uniref:zinc transporter ZIP1-like n=1 Tax=Argopecten irradians TaxID=31199 RepID=UPI003718D823
MVETAKIISILVVFGITFVAGVTPIWLLKILTNRMRNLSRLQYVVSLTNCFAGGVFLGTAILHLIQESMETVEDSFPDLEFPLSGVLIGAGFFVVLVIEHAIGICSKDEGSPFLDHGHDHHSHACNNDRHQLEQDSSARVPLLKETTPIFKNYHLTSSAKLTGSDNSGADVPDYHSITRTTTENDESQTPKAIASVEVKVTNSSTVDTSGDGRSKTTRRIRVVILVIALSIHMIFEGMAIGLQDTTAGMWTLVAALSVHKAVIVFSVGLKLKEIVESNLKIILYIAYLSVVSPIGIAIGIAVTTSGSGDDFVQDKSSGILQSLAAGTFLYVTFFEILQKELANKYSLLKVFLTLVGFAAMAALKLLDTD